MGILTGKLYGRVLIFDQKVGRNCSLGFSKNPNAQSANLHFIFFLLRSLETSSENSNFRNFGAKVYPLLVTDNILQPRLYPASVNYTKSIRAVDSERILLPALVFFS